MTRFSCACVNYKWISPSLTSGPGFEIRRTSLIDLQERHRVAFSTGYLILDRVWDRAGKTVISFSLDRNIISCERYRAFSLFPPLPYALSAPTGVRLAMCQFLLFFSNVDQRQFDRAPMASTAQHRVFLITLFVEVTRLRTSEKNAWFVRFILRLTHDD